MRSVTVVWQLILLVAATALSAPPSIPGSWTKPLAAIAAAPTVPGYVLAYTGVNGDKARFRDSVDKNTAVAGKMVTHTTVVGCAVVCDADVRCLGFFQAGTMCYIVYQLVKTGTALDGLSYTRTIVSSWTALRAAIEAVPAGSSCTFALSGSTFKCDYDSQIVLKSGAHVTVLGQGAILDAKQSGRFFFVSGPGASLALDLLTF
jgi:hypothetical protein